MYEWNICCADTSRNKVERVAALVCLYNTVVVVVVVIFAFIVIIGRDGGDGPQLIRVDQDHGKGHVQFPNREYEKCHEDHVPERQGHGAQYEQFWQ